MAANKGKFRKKDWLYVVGCILLAPFYRIVYRLKVIGRENLPSEGKVLLCCNHVAIKDPLLLATVLPRQVCFMAKAELFQNPILALILRLVGVFPVERGTGGADALARACGLLEENAVVGVFLEGHRSKTGELQKPKTGAALLAYRTKAPVVPACITGWDGKRPAPFKTTLIRFGKPLTEGDLDIADDSSMQLRRASRTIMGEIAALRETSLRELGAPLPAETGNDRPGGGEAA